MTELKPFRWVQDRIVALAEQFPERVSEDSYFDDEGKPCCIVGHVLAELGAKPMSWDTEDGWPISNADNSVWFEASECSKYIPWESLGVECPSDRQNVWVRDVQIEQDFGKPWRDAVIEAGPIQ